MMNLNYGNDFGTAATGGPCVSAAIIENVKREVGLWPDEISISLSLSPAAWKFEFATETADAASPVLLVMWRRVGDHSYPALATCE